MESALKNFKKQLIGFFIYVIIGIVLLVSIFYLPINDNYHMTIAILFLILFMVGMIRFKPRIMFYLEQIMFYRLKNNQGKNIKSNYTLESNALLDRLVSQDFVSHYKSSDDSIYSKSLIDKKQLALRKPMLIVFVTIHNQKNKFSK